MIRTFLLLTTFLAGIAWQSSITLGASAAKVVAIDDVPGLRAFFIKNYPGFKLDRKDQFLIWTIDLDEKSDGIDEIIVSVNQIDLYSCGNHGCLHEVLRRESDGSLTSIDSFIGFGIKIAPTHTNGVRDLVTVTFDGEVALNLAGKTSAAVALKKSGGKTAKAPLEKAASTQTANMSPASPAEFSGPCHHGSDWSGSGAKSGGSASYGGCGDGEYWFEFSCSTKSSQITLTIESDLRRARDGMAITVPVMVDGEKFNLRGKASFSETVGGA